MIDTDSIVLGLVVGLFIGEVWQSRKPGDNQSRPSSTSNNVFVLDQGIEISFFTPFGLDPAPTYRTKR